MGNLATDQHSQSFGVGGLSGITYLGGTTYAAVMDNSDKLIFLDVVLDSHGTILSSQISGGMSIGDSRDFEGIAYSGLQANSVYLADEATPAVHEYGLVAGTVLQSPAVPAVFQNLAQYRGFESLAFDPSTTQLWTANEEALSVDGPLATDSLGTTVRLLRYDSTGNSHTPAAQFAYEVEPIHSSFASDRSGLVELVILPDGGLLAVERSLAFSLEDGVFKTSLFGVDTTAATDVSGLTSGLINQTFTPVSKTELWSGPVTTTGMNMEGLTIGPQLGPGRWAMIGVVDDGDPLSENTVVAFELVAVPEPSSLVLICLAAACLPLFRLRGRA